LRTVAELQLGQTEKALDDILLMFRLMESCHNEPFPISQLVRASLFQQLLQPVYEGLAQHRWSEQQLDKLDVELRRLDFLTDYQFLVRGEMAVAISSLENMRHTCEISSFCDKSLMKKFWDTMKFRVIIPNGFFYQNYKYFTEKSLKYFSLFDKEHYQLHLNNVTNSLDGSKRTPYTFLANMIMPDFLRYGKSMAMAESYKNMTRIAIALERYWQAHGEYPDALALLTPQYMSIIPNDLINGNPLHYQRDANGFFTLYSVGWNQKDGNGKMSSSLFATDRDTVDWVWKYPAKGVQSPTSP